MNTYGLVRVSTLSQKDNTSLEFQSNRIKDYCRMYNLPLKEIISETESGGKNVDDRTGLNKLKSLMETGKCKTIIVNKVDRLGRSLLQGLLFLKHCEEHAVRVVCIENGIDTDNPQSKLITNILFSIAESEKST
ncbi:MAG: recombinase family protein, partial [Candidatus Marinimicrobia bacterium]|nr:recombinase family protein [Candidatus Neomarinimicrobiota bacterium]